MRGVLVMSSFFGFLGYRERGGERNRRCKRGEEKPFSPVFACPREEDDVQCHQNSTVLLFFFNEQ